MEKYPNNCFTVTLKRFVVEPDCPEIKIGFPRLAGAGNNYSMEPLLDCGKFDCYINISLLKPVNNDDAFGALFC